MTTYQNYRKGRLKIAYFESNKFLRAIFTAIFVTATFIVPTSAAVKFLFF
ncbi:hypothetical protein [Methylotenera sp.]|nr:hypothetical protein [Methylotenera sp.]MDI1361221.1 hypothetical protein [Methylotenera sp.]